MLETIGRYQIEAVLGKGEIATVYQARDPVADVRLALKVLRHDATVADAAAYFRNEAVLLAQFNHRYIPMFFEFDEGEPSYIAMEAVRGTDLLQMLEQRETHFPIRAIVRWGIQLCEALAYLHNRKAGAIAFRDLKPAHVIIDNRHQVRLVDFNLAIALPSDKILRDAPNVGTEGYSPPEQYHGIASPHSDIYALGATLYHIATRRDPRRHERFSIHEVKPRDVNPDLPLRFEQALLKATEYRPADRYQRVEDFGAALLGVFEGLVVAESLR